MISATW